MEMNHPILVGAKLTSPLAKIPAYGTDGSACFDISCIHGGVVEAHSSLAFDTGLAFEIPAGWRMDVYSRSGHGFKNGVRLGNCVAKIDSDYRGNLMIKLHNDSDTAFEVKAGDRIAQGELNPVYRVEFLQVQELSDTERGAGGFGSTGAR